MNATLEQHPLMSPVTTGQVDAERQTMRQRAMDRVFRFAARLAFGKEVVAAVDNDYVTHAALARQDSANRQSPPEVQDYFKVDLSHLPLAVIGGRMEQDTEPHQVQPVEALQHEVPQNQHQDPEQR
jgi:hypothetical protein